VKAQSTAGLDQQQLLVGFSGEFGRARQREPESEQSGQRQQQQ